MGRTRVLAAAVVAGLVAAAPAAAINGGSGALAALRGGKVLEVSATGDRGQHSCQANRTGDKVSSSQLGRKFAPVACEYPPKANLLTPNALSKAVANALTTVG